MAEGVRISFKGYAEFSVSGNGTLFYGRRGSDRKGAVRMAGPCGKAVGKDRPAAGHRRSIFSLSPDGSRVAYIFAGVDKSDIWVLEWPMV